MEKKNLLIDVPAEASACSCCSSASQEGGGGNSPGAASAVDPVCGMDVDPATAKATFTHEAQTYYFCAPGCRRAFEQDPASYLTPTAGA